jgi:hypothetical protein
MACTQAERVTLDLDEGAFDLIELHANGSLLPGFRGIVESTNCVGSLNTRQSKV